ncbi:epithelial cell adhesion molecule-like [Sarcophilus harrisii]
MYEDDVITIELMQNDIRKNLNDNDMDIADVVYYFEKDIKEESIFYIRLKASVIGVIVVVVVALVAGIVMLLIPRKKRWAKYEKAEIKEMTTKI